MTNSQRKLDAFRAGNRLAAEIIASNQAKYPPGSLNPPAERTAPGTREAA